MESKILFVVVLYNERLSDCNTYKTLLCNYDNYPLFVYDNSPISMNYHVRSNLFYVHDSSNPGISFAYNQAAIFAKENNYEWMLFLDQDTIFPSNIIQDYLISMENNPQIKMFLPRVMANNDYYMSPSISRFRISYLSLQAPIGIISLKKYTAINSGLLVNIDAFINVGGYDESVFLDFSDHEFIRRFRMKYESVFVIDSVCMQNFSSLTQSSDQKNKRFSLFCLSLINCNRRNLFDSFCVFIIIIKRMLVLLRQTNSLVPLKILISICLNKCKNK